jgi:DNA modification methylase
VADFEIKLGDCLESLRAMPDKSVHCCVTSPPYFGLRDYGVDGQIGLEPTPDEFVQALVAVFREVRRVLRDDGTLWLNLGDSYANDGKWGGNSGGKHATALHGNTSIGRTKVRTGLKPKELIGIPWRVAFALQADGWYLRQDIIWQKPNPMPESVRDRCTKAHEYIFLLSKSPRYYYDAEAVKEPAAESSIQRWAQDVESQAGSDRVPGKTNGSMKAVGGQRSKRYSFSRETATTPPPGAPSQHRPDREDKDYAGELRNRRSVWTVSTRPYKGAHFATFPSKLIEPCILAGCPVGGTVLDPFGGSGTTAGVALAHDRNAVLCELNPEYAELVPARIESILAAYGKPKNKKARKTPANDNTPQLELFAGKAG